MQNQKDLSKPVDFRIPPKSIIASEAEMLRSKGYILRNTIGEGTYSKVKRACSIKMTKDLAIKIISRDEIPEIFKKKFLPWEVEILSAISHPNIVKVYEIFETKCPDRLYIVTEYFHHGDLLDFVKAKGAMSETDSRPIFTDICRALIYLHQSNIAHRDIKCENILLHVATGSKPPRLQAKLCDFGFARRYPARPHRDYSHDGHKHFSHQPWMSNTFCGSAAYASPEILERKLHSPMPADVWATGIVMFITLYGAMPFDDSDIRGMIKLQKRGDVTNHQRSDKVSNLARDLIGSILRPNPRHRPTMPALLRHKWFHEVQPAALIHKQLFDQKETE